VASIASFNGASKQPSLAFDLVNLWWGWSLEHPNVCNLHSRPQVLWFLMCSYSTFNSSNHLDTWKQENIDSAHVYYTQLIL
jgi:hypothetical protein